MTAAAIGTKPASNTSVCLFGEANELIGGQECSRCLCCSLGPRVSSDTVRRCILRKQRHIRVPKLMYSDHAWACRAKKGSGGVGDKAGIRISAVATVEVVQHDWGAHVAGSGLRDFKHRTVAIGVSRFNTTETKLAA